MLEGLAKIDWGNIRHCYGPANDLPNLLRDLISSDLQRREEVLTLLHSSISHQGTINEATSHAVPFLWEIAGGSAPCDRSGVIALIGAIANGGGYHAKPTPQERSWIAQSRAAVRKGLEIAESHLTSTDVTLRMLSAHVLTSFPEDAERSRPALRSALQQETDTRRRAALGMSLMLLGDSASEAFTSGPLTDLPLAQLQRLAQRAVNGLTESQNVLNVIFDLSLPTTTAADVIDMLADRAPWGGEDDV